MSSHHCPYTYQDYCFLHHFWLVFFHSSSWGWLVKLVWVWRKPWRRKLLRTTRRLMTDFEPSSAGRCQDSRDRVPWAVETEVCKKMFSLKLSSLCDVAAEATFHSFGLIALQTCEVFQDGGTMLPFLCSCQLSENSQISQNVKKTWRQLRLLPWHHRKKNCCRISNYILKIKGVRENLCIFPTLPERFGTYYYLHIAETFLPAILTACLILLKMEARGKSSERSDIPQHYVTTFPTSVDEVERFTGAFL